MLDRARQYVSSELGDISKQNQIEFVQSAAEDLRFLKDGSVDLLFSCMWTAVVLNVQYLTLLHLP